MRIERVGLEDHGDASVAGLDIVDHAVADFNFAVGNVFKPGIMRSKVDLPQPDGPTKTTNSPWAMSRSTPLITGTSP